MLYEYHSMGYELITVVSTYTRSVKFKPDQIFEWRVEEDMKYQS